MRRTHCRSFIGLQPCLLEHACFSSFSFGADSSSVPAVPVLGQQAAVSMDECRLLSLQPLSLPKAWEKPRLPSGFLDGSVHNGKEDKSGWGSWRCCFQLCHNYICIGQRVNLMIRGASIWSLKCLAEVYNRPWLLDLVSFPCVAHLRAFEPW